MSQLLLERRTAKRLSHTHIDERYLSRNNKRVAQALLENSRYYGTRDDWEIFLLEYCSARSGVSQEYLISEGFFDAIKKMGNSVSAMAGNATAGIKQGMAQHLPQLYAHGTHQFWKHGELAKKAKAAYEEVFSKLEKTQDQTIKKFMTQIKTTLQKGAKGMDFPNMRDHADFMDYLFGVKDWDEFADLEKKLKAATPEALGKMMKENGGIWWAMLGARNYLQTQVSSGNVPMDEMEDKVKEYNAVVERLKKLLRYYAREVKEVYRTFESKQYVHHGKLTSLLIEQPEEEPQAAPKDKQKPKGEYDASEEAKYQLQHIQGETEEDLEKHLDGSIVKKIKQSQSPLVPAILALLGIIAAATGMKLNNDALEKMLSKVENLPPEWGEKTVEGIKELPKAIASEKGMGLTQFARVASNTVLGTELSAEDVQNMKVTEFKKLLGELGMGEEFFKKSLSDPGKAAELLKGADGDMSVVDFFKQSSEQMSGKTMQSPFGFKGAVLKYVSKEVTKKTAKYLVKAGTAKGATAVAATQMPALVFAAPYLALGAGAGFATVALLRKFKNNRFKTLEALIDQLEPIENVVDFDPEIIKPSPVVPEPKKPPKQDPKILPPVIGVPPPVDPITREPEEAKVEEEEFIEKEEKREELGPPDIDPHLEKLKPQIDLVIRALMDRGYEKAEAEALMDSFFDDSDEGLDNIADLTDDRPPKPEALMAGFVHRSSLTSLLVEDADNVIPFGDFEQRMKSAAKRAKVPAPEQNQNVFAAVAFNISHQIGDVDQLPAGGEKIEIDRTIKNIEKIEKTLIKKYKKKYKGKYKSRWKKDRKKLMKSHLEELGLKDLDIEKLKKKAKKMKKASEKERQEFKKEIKSLKKSMKNAVSAKDVEIGKLNSAIEALRAEMLENEDQITKEKQAEIDALLEKIGLSQKELEERDMKLREMEDELGESGIAIDDFVTQVYDLEQTIADLEAKVEAGKRLTDEAANLAELWISLSKGDESDVIPALDKHTAADFGVYDTKIKGKKKTAAARREKPMKGFADQLRTAADAIDTGIEQGAPFSLGKKRFGDEGFDERRTGKKEAAWHKGDVITERWQKLAGLLKD